MDEEARQQSAKGEKKKRKSQIMKYSLKGKAARVEREREKEEESGRINSSEKLCMILFHR